MKINTWKNIVIFILIVTNFIFIYICHSQNDLIDKQNELLVEQNKSLGDTIYLLDMKVEFEKELVSENIELREYIRRNLEYIEYLKGE